MKKVFLTGLLALSAAANAGDWYVGGSFSVLDTEHTIFGASADAQPTSLNLVFGHKFHRNFAVEGLVGFGVSDDSVGGVYDFELDSIVGVSAVGILPISDSFELFAKLGYAQADYSDSDGDDADASGAIYGVGSNYSISSNLALTLEYTVYPDGDYDNFPIDVETDAVSFGLNYQF